MKKLMILSAALLLVAVCVKAVADQGMVGTCPCDDGSTGMLVSGGKCFKDGSECRKASESQNATGHGSVQRTAKPS